MMTAIGDRRIVQGPGLAIFEDEYQPDATPWREGLVTWQPGKLGRPAGAGWVRIWGGGMHYSYIDDHGERHG